MRLLRSPGIVISVAAALLLVALLIYGQASTSPDRSIDRAISKGERKAAPVKSLDRLFGDGEGSVADYRGKIVLVNFWASWCAPCREEAPVLQGGWERYRHRGVVFLGIDSLDIVSDARHFVERYHLTYPMLRDQQGSQRKAWGLTGFPETFVLDPDGKIAALSRGQIDRKMLDGLLLPVLEENEKS